MDKSKTKTLLFKFLSVYGALTLLIHVFILTRKYFKSDRETFWERHPFENSLEKADDFCEIGFTFQKNEIIYKKIYEKKWFAEILIPDDDKFEIGCELAVENYIYKKIGKKA